VSETERVVDTTDGDGMERTPVRVDSIDIKRAPGFETGGVSLDGLSPGVNVVCGGNAAGKTTLSRAIRWSLWPDSDDVPDRANIRTELTYDGEGRTVLLGSGVTQHLKDGADADPIPVPSLADGERYTLSLEEMLQPSNDGGAFADAIQRESTGGFDVDAVRASLGLDGGVSPSTRNLGETQVAEEAVNEVKRRRQSATDLSTEREELERVNSELREAADARKREELLNRAVAFAEVRDEYREAEREVASFPEELAQFDGSEIETLEAVDTAIARHEEDIWEAATKDREAAAEMAATGLDEPIPESELATLRESHQKIDESESDRDRLERELESTKTERREARDEIPLDLDDDALRTIEADDMDDLRGFLSAVVVAEGAERAREEVDKAFETVTEATVEADRETLVSGRDALADWLAEPVRDDDTETDEEPTDDRLRPVTVGAGLLVAVAGVAVGFSGNPLGFLLALVGVAQAVYAWTTGDSETEVNDQPIRDPRETHRERFVKTGLEAPTEWTREAVTDRLSDLRDGLAALETAETATDARDRLQAEFDESDAEELVETTRERLRESLGVDPREDDEIELGVAVERIDRWQAADKTVASKREELQTARGQLESRLSEFRERIAPYVTGDYDYEIETAADAAGVIESLSSRADDYRAARDRRDGVVDEVSEARARLTEARADYEALFTDRGLAVGDEDRLRTLAEQYDDYDAAVSGRGTAETKLQQRRGDLKDHDDYDPTDELEERDVSGLGAEREEVRERAADHDELLETKSDLENQIASAKESTDVEEALTERDEALSELESAFREDAGDAVADELLDAVEDATAATSRQPVFRRADDLLREITNGSFELRLDDGEFYAYDTGQGRRVELDDLSTGTRVQVLLSVRVAFVEYREGQTAPPLLFDDTLAVFDDLRAEAVLETLVEFARAGRQVFYFTASGHDLVRLRERLDETEVPHAIHYLDGVYDEDPTSRTPRVDTDWTPVDVPAPESDDHEAYRQLLNVPTFDPREGAETAHLWYVTEEPEVLYDLLSVRIERWGHLRSLLDSGRVGGLLSDDARDGIERNGVALETFADAYTVGRGKPVDRSVLKDSGAVSEKFIDEASILAEDVDGDPEEVLNGLSEEVNYFRNGKVEELREYLREQGYLDSRQTLSDDEIRLAVVDAYANAGLSGEEPEMAAKRLLDNVSEETELDE